MCSLIILQIYFTFISFTNELLCERNWEFIISIKIDGTNAIIIIIIVEHYFPMQKVNLCTRERNTIKHL